MIKYLLISHTFATGPTQELRDYLIKKKSDFSFLEHPFNFSKFSKTSQISFYKKGKLIFKKQAIEIKLPLLFSYLRDFLTTIFFVISLREKYDICIAADNLNTFSVWFLKKLGYIHKIIYWSIDYVPQRFNNQLLNHIYHSIDRFCCYHADLLWNSSKRMKLARKKNGVDIDRCSQEVIVYDGCHFESIRRLKNKEVNRYKLVFLGHLTKDKGIELTIEALKELRKNYKKINLTIIGTGPEETTLKRLVRKLRLIKCVNFTGFIENHRHLEKIVATCAIGLAPYSPNKNNLSFYSEVGKIKIYLACGLPVLITDVPEIAKKINQKKAGMIIRYDKQDLTTKILSLITNKRLYFQYRKNAVNFVRKYNWDNVFNNAIKNTENKLALR